MVSTPGKLCSACAAILDVDGAGISLIAGGQLQGLLCATDETVTRLERLQFDLGEGPCGSAFSTSTPVLQPALDEATERWPVFAAEALDLGVRAVFAFPLGPGLAGVGALTLYRDSARDLTAEQLADGLVLADVIAEIILAIQLDTPVDDLTARLATLSDARIEVYQATGMVAAQLDVPPADALSRLRAHAWSSHRPLAEIAAEVVARRLRFAPDMST